MPQVAILRPGTAQAQIAEAIFADTARFQSTKDRFDDETILVLRVR